MLRWRCRRACILHQPPLAFPGDPVPLSPHERQRKVPSGWAKRTHASLPRLCQHWQAHQHVTGSLVRSYARRPQLDILGIWWTCNDGIVGGRSTSCHSRRHPGWLAVSRSAPLLFRQCELLQNYELCHRSQDVYAPADRTPMISASAATSCRC